LASLVTGDRWPVLGGEVIGHAHSFQGHYLRSNRIFD